MAHNHRSTTRHKSPARIGTFHIITWIWVLVALVVIAAILLAPEKPPAPPVSEMSYQPPPKPAERFQPLEPVVETDAPPPVAREEHAGRFTIFGHVTAAGTGEPVAQAHVACKLIRSDEQKRNLQELRDIAATTRDRDDMDEFLEFEQSLKSLNKYTRTDRNGRYEFCVPYPGGYHLAIRADGYRPAYDQDAVVTEEQPEMQVDFHLSRGASISGRVTESGSRSGVAGISVSAGGEAAVTDDNGDYKVTGLDIGTHEVTLYLRDSPYLAAGVVPSQQVVIERQDEEIEGIDFQLEPAGIVWGFVLSTDNMPVSRADVVLCTSENLVRQAIDNMTKMLETGGELAQVMHDRSEIDGYYALFGVPFNKEWRIAVNAKKYAPQLSDPFLLTSSQRSLRVDIFVMPGTTVYGRVVSVERTPVPRADVWCMPAYTRFFAPMDTPIAPFKETRSDKNGDFEINDLPAGDYQLLAHHEDYKASVVGEPVSSDGSRDIYDIELVLTPVDMGEYTVFGTVTDTSGYPLEGVRLGLLSMGSTMATAGRDTTSDTRGYYEFAGVDPGILILNAEKNGFSSRTVNKVMLDEPTNIVLEAASTVTGRVLVRETGAAPPHYSVRAMPASAGEQDAMSFFEMAEGLDSRGFSNDDGGFSIELPPGRYSLEGRAHGYTPGRTEITLTAGQQLDGVTIYVSRHGGKIHGRVTTADGRSAQGANVWISRHGRSFGALLNAMADLERGAVTVGADGGFEFDNLAEGAYDLTARHPRYAQAQSGPVRVGAGQTVSGVELVLGFGGSLQGYVSIDGQLTAGAIVTLIGNNISKMTTTDRNGQYIIEDVPAGSYLASAASLQDGSFMSMFAPLHARVEIYEGRTTVHNFGEETGTTVVGICEPPPKFGTAGFAVIRIPGAPGGMSGMNFANPLSWFTEDSTNANYVVGMSQFGSDGYFKIDNVPPGMFLLEVYYLDLTEMLSGVGRPGYSETINITDQEVVELYVTVPEE